MTERRCRVFDYVGTIVYGCVDDNDNDGRRLSNSLPIYSVKHTSLEERTSAYVCMCRCVHLNHHTISSQFATIKSTTSFAAKRWESERETIYDAKQNNTDKFLPIPPFLTIVHYSYSLPFIQFVRCRRCSTLHNHFTPNRKKNEKYKTKTATAPSNSQAFVCVWKEDCGMEWNAKQRNVVSVGLSLSLTHSCTHTHAHT